MFLPGIILFIVAYMLLTAFRDFRDNFSAEIWKSLGYGNSPSIYTQTEVPVSIAVLLIIGSTMLIKNNKRALMINHLIIALGMLMVGASTWLFQAGALNSSLWMTLVGVGLYMGYVPFNSIFFDRLLAAFRIVGTVGFVMYVADAFGYLGSIFVLFYKEFTNKALSWLNFFIYTGYAISLAGTLLIIGSMVYFHLKYRQVRGVSEMTKLLS